MAPSTSDEVPSESVEDDAIDIVVRKGPSTPKPWISLGSEIEVIDEKVVENRPKVSVIMLLFGQDESYITLITATLRLFC